MGEVDADVVVVADDHDAGGEQGGFDAADDGVLAHHSATVTWLGFQPGSPLLASAGEDGSAALWKPGTDDLPLTTVAVDDRITTAAWSSAGGHLALGGANDTLAIAEVT